MMTMDQQLPRAAPVDSTEHSVLASWWSGVHAWVIACSDAYVASAMYEDCRGCRTPNCGAGD